MLNIILNLDTGVATLAGSNTVKSGAQVPVQIATQNSAGVNAAPDSTPYFQLAVSAQQNPPSVLAYTDAFAAENDHTFTGYLDCTDSRLIQFMAGKSSVTLDCELDYTIDTELEISPTFQVACQPRIINGPTTSNGGPSYLTEAQCVAQFAKIDGSGNVLIGSNARLVPVASGLKVQVSVDGITWQDDKDIVAS